MGFVFNRVAGFPIRDQNDYLQELESEPENERAQHEGFEEEAAGWPKTHAQKAGTLPRACFLNKMLVGLPLSPNGSGACRLLTTAPRRN